MDVRAGCVGVTVVVALSVIACGDDHGTAGGGSGKSPHDVCVDMNDTQRAATKLGDDLSAATSNEKNDSLTNDANAVNQDLSSALASGAFIGTPVQQNLQTAIHAAQQIETDLLRPDVAQASLDFGALKNAMSQLGADCSQYLT